MKEEYKTIRISKRLWDYLNKKAQQKGETYEEILKRLLKVKEITQEGVKILKEDLKTIKNI